MGQSRVSAKYGIIFECEILVCLWILPSLVHRRVGYTIYRYGTYCARYSGKASGLQKEIERVISILEELLYRAFENM